MVVFINGSFGVGKTTVAGHLRDLLPGGTLYDPEIIGSRLHRLFGRIAPTDDFQTYRLWRTFVAGDVRRLHRVGPVIVPMTLSNPLYFKQVVGVVRKRERDVHHFCLVAPQSVIEQRLIARDCDHGPGSWPWVRVAKCCEAFESELFEHKIDATKASPLVLAEEIRDRLRSSGT